MVDLQPYHFEPERVPNPEDSESENEEANNRLEAHFVFVSDVKCFLPRTARERKQN